MKLARNSLAEMYGAMAADRYNTEKRHAACAGENDLPFPAFGEWLYYEVRVGRYNRIARMLFCEVTP